MTVPAPSIHDRAVMARTVYRTTLGLDPTVKPTPDHMAAWEETVRVIEGVAYARLLEPIGPAIAHARNQVDAIGATLTQGDTP